MSHMSPSSLSFVPPRRYGEEIIDHKAMVLTREWNDTVQTWDYVKDGVKGRKNLVFRTCAEEKGRVVFQIGTTNAVRALKSAELVSQDVAGLDVNMGCPKHFSISGGMGAALLKKPEVAEDILKTLRRNLNIPVTCKIRLLERSDDVRSTVEFVRRLEAAGAQAIGVHMRSIHERPCDPARWKMLAPVVAAVPDTPIIANGDAFSLKDAAEIKEMSGCSSVMFARAAMWNPSVFRTAERGGPMPLQESIHAYLRVCSDTGNAFNNTKYVVQQMLRHTKELGGAQGVALGRAKSARAVCAVWGEEAEAYQVEKEAEWARMLAGTAGGCGGGGEGGEGSSSKDQGDGGGGDSGASRGMMEDTHKYSDSYFAEGKEGALPTEDNTDSGKRKSEEASEADEADAGKRQKP